MCRHLVYLGPPVPLAALIFDPPHSLARQSWAPVDMRGGGTVNADGFGIGWYPAAGTPLRYRRDHPLWSDPDLPALAGATRSGAVLAAVRSATTGMPVTASAVAPFAEGPWLFSHNGVVRGWPDTVAPLATRLPTRDLLTLDAPTDAALLWALVRHRLRGGAPHSAALAATVTEVLAAAPGSRLNLLLTDGRQAVATAAGHALSVRAGQGAVLIASEPLDTDPGWQPVADGTLVTAGAGRVTTTALAVATAMSDPNEGDPMNADPMNADALDADALEICLGERDLAEALRHDVRLGLTARPRWLPPKWFYDARGSELFEEITRLPEYYPTRTERSILAAHAAEIARRTGAKTLIELGSGSSEKTRLLLDALCARGELGTFAPLDVSESALRQSTAAIAAGYPGLRVRGIVGDFFRHLDRLPTGGPRLVAFLGGTIGNLVPVERAAFLRSMRAVLEPGDWLLLGADLVKDPAVLVPAYDDAAGVTAEFNRNVLRVVNRELAADFDPDGFDHVAVWDPEQRWIEMRLRARRRTRVRVAALDLDVDFAEGEELRTEISAKLRPDEIRAELAMADFATRAIWTDSDALFAVALGQAV